jgi:gliding motility-associated-like protein
MKRITYILSLIITLLSGLGSYGQTPYVIDEVCVGADRHYRVDGEAGSTYIWTLTNPDATTITLPETGDAVNIVWNVPAGVYSLSTVQHNPVTGCDGLLELGTITVYDGPVAYAGPDQRLCTPAPYYLASSDITNVSTVLWTTSGDGTFDDPAILHPTYTFGANDILNGSVTLTLTAQGLGNSGSCPPAESPVIITLDNLLVDPVITPVSCSGSIDGTVQLNVSSGFEPYTFTLNTIPPVTNTTGLFTGLAEGTYSYTINGSSLCESTGEFTITGPEPLVVIVTGTDPTTLGGSDGTATANVTGGTPPYTYQWDDPLGQTTQTAVGLLAGTYSVRVFDAHGCDVSGIVTITDPPPSLAVNILITNITCFGANDGQLTAVATGGYLPYEYLWDDPLAQTTATATLLAPGTYMVTVTDSHGTVVTASATVSEPPALVVTITSFNPTLPGGNDGSATANVTGGTPPYSYLWDDPAAQTTQTAVGLMAGTYLVTVTDANGCTITESVTLTDPPATLAVQVQVLGISCFGANNGQATAIATGGMPPYSYLWDDPLNQTTAVAINLAPGTYTVTVTDFEGTVVTGSGIVIEPAVLVVGITGINPTTLGGNDGIATANPVGGTPPYSYLWDDPAMQTTQTATGLPAGTYTVTVTDANGCTATNTITLTDPNLAVGVWINNMVSCFGGSDGSATASASGGTPPYSYLWNDPLNQTTPTATGLQAGTYTVTVTDFTGIMATASVTITEPSEIIVTVTHINPTVIGASDGSATATVTGGTPPYSYLWDDPAAQTTPTATGLAAGTYNVTVTDANGCTATGSTTLTDPLPELAVTVNIDQQVSCFDGSDGQATAIVTGGLPPYSYLWDPTGQTTATATGLSAGTYTVTVTDAEGTVVIVTVIILQPEQFNVTVSLEMAGCHGASDGSITFNNPTGGSGNYAYSIDGGITWQSSPSFTGLTAGPYYPAISDAMNNSCLLALEPVNISESEPVVVTIQQSTFTTCGLNNGSIDVNANGGTAPYEYMLDGFTTWQPTDIFTDLAPASYTVRVRDVEGCETAYNLPVIIEAITPVNIVTINVLDHSVNGDPSGSAVIIAESPAMPIQYSIDKINWQLSDTIADLPGGPYTAYAMDANGCIDSLTFVIGNVVYGTIELESGRVTACIGEIKTLEVVVYDFDSIASFTIQLQYDHNILHFLNLNYVNPVLNIGTVSAIETTPGVLEISYTGPGDVSIPDGEMLLSLNMQGLNKGLTDFNWNWLKCIVTSPFGYLHPPTAVVNSYAEVFANPSLVAYKDGEFCAGDSTILHAETDMTEITFEWTHPRGVKHYGDTWNLGTLSPLDSGDYLVRAAHDQCFSLDTVHIKVFEAPEVFISYSDTLCFGNPVVLDPGTGFTNYEWNTGSIASSIIAYEPGVYWVKVFDANGCRAVDSVELVPCVIDVLIPNAFTPNGDGLNDDFKPLFSGFEPAQYRMDIYSKWGQRIFTTGDVGEGWDGTVDGVLVDPDTFVYVISYEVPSYVLRQGLKSPITGRVSVLR